MQTEEQHEVEAEWIPETIEEFLEYHEERIDRIATSKWNRQGFCRAEDVAQEIRLHVVEKWDHYVGLNAEQSARNFEKAASQYLQSESQDYMYFSGSFVYTPRMVRGLLAEAAWEEAENCPDVDGKVDILMAWATLSPASKAAVFRRYGQGVSDTDLSEAESRAARRGVDSITHQLNRKDAPRSRTLDELRHELGLGR